MMRASFLMDRKRRAAWLLVAAGTTALDLWSKAQWKYPEKTLEPTNIAVIEDWFYIRTVWNRGGIWSLEIPQAVLYTATLLAVPALLIWLFWPKEARSWENAAKALVLGGAAGNLYDRFRFDAVRDFIDVCFGNVEGWHYPTFNVADAALLVGIVILLVLSFREERKKKAAGA